MPCKKFYFYPLFLHMDFVKKKTFLFPTTQLDSQQTTSPHKILNQKAKLQKMFRKIYFKLELYAAVSTHFKHLLIDAIVLTRQPVCSLNRYFQSNNKRKTYLLNLYSDLDIMLDRILQQNEQFNKISKCFVQE